MDWWIVYLLKSVFSEIRVRTWVQKVSCQKNRPLIGRSELEACCFLPGNYLNSCLDTDLRKNWLWYYFEDASVIFFRSDRLPRMIDQNQSNTNFFSLKEKKFYPSWWRWWRLFWQRTDICCGRQILTTIPDFSMYAYGFFYFDCNAMHSNLSHFWCQIENSNQNK